MFETWKTVEIVRVDTAGQSQVDPAITESAQQAQPSEYPGAETQAGCSWLQHCVLKEPVR